MSTHSNEDLERADEGNAAKRAESAKGAEHAEEGDVAEGQQRRAQDILRQLDVGGGEHEDIKLVVLGEPEGARVREDLERQLDRVVRHKHQVECAEHHVEVTGDLERAEGFGADADRVEHDDADRQAIEPAADDEVAHEPVPLRSEQLGRQGAAGAAARAPLAGARAAIPVRAAAGRRGAPALGPALAR